MTWAIEAHEATKTGTEIFKIREIIRDNPDYFIGVARNNSLTVNKAINSMEVSKDNKFRDAFFTVKSLLSTMNCPQSFSWLEKYHFTQEWFKDSSYSSKNHAQETSCNIYHHHKIL